MKKILLRSGKVPFEARSAEATLDRGILGSNSGNLVFAHATYKTIALPETEITSDNYRAYKMDPDEVNERYDAYVVPLANAFRVSFLPTLELLTTFIKKLKIPVIVPGVGAQSDTDYSLAKMAPINEPVKAFVSAVLDKSASMGVRGEFTGNYLKSLGFENVDVIGCPSMFLNGPSLKIKDKPASATKNMQLALNISPYLQDVVAQVFLRHMDAYPNSIYIPQDSDTLAKMLWGEPVKTRHTESKMPVFMTHPVFQTNRARYFVDPSSWINALKKRDFSFGTRIHGNITSLLAGTPAYVFAHDSRVLELVRYFKIPHRLVQNVSPDLDVSELIAEADYSEMVSGHQARFENWTRFLDKNNVPHIWQKDAPASNFDKKISQTTFASPVFFTPGKEAQALLLRMRYLRAEMRKQEKVMETQLEKVKKERKALANRVRKLEKARRKAAKKSARKKKRRAAK